MITLKDFEDEKEPSVDEWAERQIQSCFSEIKKYQKEGQLPQTLDSRVLPLTMFMPMGMFDPIGVYRINVALEKYNRESSRFRVFVETKSPGESSELVVTLSSKSESPEEKKMSFWTKTKVACIQFARRELK